MFDKEIIERAKVIKTEAEEKYGVDGAPFHFCDCIAAAVEEAKEVKTFDIAIDITGEPRKGGVYVAKITGLDPKWGLKRNFGAYTKNLHEAKERNTKNIFGTITVNEGDIIEIGRGGSWKNRYHDLFIVENGELKGIEKKEAMKILVA